MQKRYTGLASYKPHRRYAIFSLRRQMVSTFRNNVPMKAGRAPLIGMDCLVFKKKPSRQAICVNFAAKPTECRVKKKSALEMNKKTEDARMLGWQFNCHPNILTSTWNLDRF
jgi:hypothetical protein